MYEKIAIVTGTSGSIGIEFVALMLEEGVDEIWCIAKSLEKLNILRGKYGERIVPLSFDLSLQESITEIIELLEKGQPEVLFLIKKMMSWYYTFSSFFIDAVLLLFLLHFIDCHE